MRADFRYCKDYFENLAGILGTEGDMLKSLMDDKKKECELVTGNPEFKQVEKIVKNRWIR